LYQKLVLQKLWYNRGLKIILGIISTFQRITQPF
jgi:hypothetical protein